MVPWSQLDQTGALRQWPGGQWPVVPAPSPNTVQGLAASPKVPPVPASGSHYVQRGETIALFIAGREPRNGLGFDAH